MNKTHQQRFEFYNPKHNRHSSHKKTYPLNTCFPNDTTIESQEPQMGTVFRSPNIHRSQASDSKGIQKKKMEQSAEQIYHLKKNAYKNYIREIYQKINDELKKKNSYFSIVTTQMK